NKKLFATRGIVRCGAQSFRGAFRCDVPLRRSEHFVADHKFAYGGGAKERRGKERGGVALPAGAIVRRLLVESHGVRKGSLKQIVVTRSELLEDFAQAVALSVGHLRHGAEMAAGKNHCFKRPNGPEGNEGEEVVIFEDDALFATAF